MKGQSWATRRPAGSAVNHYYATTYKRINGKYRAETIERHEARLMAAVDARNAAIAKAEEGGE